MMTTNNSSGQRVLDYLVESANPAASACHSFTRLSDDNSTLAHAPNCLYWGGGDRWESQWTGRKIEIVPNMSTWTENAKMVSFPRDLRCDDDGAKSSVSAGDLWRLYAR